MAMIFTAHARSRMVERGVSGEQVESVLETPEGFRDDPDKRSVRLEGVVDGRTLRVWVVAPWPQGDMVVVKSVAWKD